MDCADPADSSASVRCILVTIQEPRKNGVSDFGVAGLLSEWREVGEGPERRAVLSIFASSDVSSVQPCLAPTEWLSGARVVRVH